MVYMQAHPDLVYQVFYHIALYENIQQRTKDHFYLRSSNPDLRVSLVRPYPEKENYALIC